MSNCLYSKRHHRLRLRPNCASFPPQGGVGKLFEACGHKADQDRPQTKCVRLFRRSPFVGALGRPKTLDLQKGLIGDWRASPIQASGPRPAKGKDLKRGRGRRARAISDGTSACAKDQSPLGRRQSIRLAPFTRAWPERRAKNHYETTLHEPTELFIHGRDGFSER